MQDLRHSGGMAGEVALCTFRYTSSTPSDEDVFRKAGIGVLDLDKSVLDTTFVEILEEISELAVYGPKLALPQNPPRLEFIILLPPVLCTLRTLSFDPLS